MDCTCKIKYIEGYEPEPKFGSDFLYGKTAACQQDGDTVT